MILIERATGTRSRAREKRGSLQADPLESSKSYLEGRDDPEVAAVFEDADLDDVLKQEERKPLKSFI